MIKQLPYFSMSIMIIMLIIGGCTINTQGKKMSQTSIEIFKDTPAYKLAKAVKYQNIFLIRKICENEPDVMYIQDPFFSYTVLHWAVGMEKYWSVKTLLEMGMDPDIPSARGNETPLFIASGYSFIDIFAKTNPKYVKILLEYGANPDIACTEIILPDLILPDGRSTPQYGPNIEGKTPLMNVATVIGKSRMEKAKLLVEMGKADINQTTASGETATVYALRLKDIDLAQYLIVECNADITIPFLPERMIVDIIRETGEEPEPSYPVSLLRRMVCRLDSKEYQQKMEIVAAFERQGVDYWKESIPVDVIKRIKLLYPETWQEYIKVY